MGSNKWDDNSSLHVSTILKGSSSKVLPFGADISTPHEPIVLLRCRIVRTLTVIKSEPVVLGIKRHIFRDFFEFLSF